MTRSRRPGPDGPDRSGETEDLGEPERRGATTSETWRHHLRYRFDNLLARGTWATLVWLGVVTLLAVVFSSLLLAVFGVAFAGSESTGWLEDVWQSLLRVMDPGTMASDTGWGRRVLALTVTVFGLLVAGTLIGIIASGVEDRITHMRRGRTIVIESGHLVVLGATDQLAGVVRQVALGATAGAPTTVVVLADEDPATIHAWLRAVPFDRRAVRLVLRSGDPSVLADLELTRPGRARGVVVLHDDRPDDAGVVRTVLAVDDLLRGDPAVPVVVEVRDEATAGRLVDACGPTVHPLQASLALSRSAVFALRGPELGMVSDELLQVGGGDVHVVELSEEVGSRFGDLVHRPTAARPIGLVDATGRVHLHPAPDRLVAAGDRLAFVGQVSAANRVAGSSMDRSTAPGAGRPGARTVDPGSPGEQVLVVGWSRFAARLLAEWIGQVGPGVGLEVVVTDPERTGHDIEVPTGASATVVHADSLAAHLADRGGLADLSTVLLVADDDRRTADEADIRTLLDLGVVRRARGGHPTPRIIVQVLDVDDVPLAWTGQADDWLIDPGVTAQLLVQLVDQPDRRAVMLALYGDRGTSLDVVAAESLGLVGPVDMAEVVAAADRAGLLAIGWCRRRDGHRELDLAPSFDARVELAPEDVVVVLT